MEIQNINQYNKTNLMKLIIVLITLIGCSNKMQSSDITNEKPITSARLLQDSASINIGFDFKLVGSIKKVGKSSKQEEGNTNVGCKTWILEKESLHDILVEMEKVEANEWYTLCYQYSCWYEGVVIKDNQEYSISISPGSYIIISREDETIHFILGEPSGLFLSACDCCE